MDEQLSAILAEVTPRLGEWYPDRAAGPDVRVDVQLDDRRSINRVIRLRVISDGADVASLIVKTENPDPVAPILPDERPRLMPVTDSAIRQTLEFEALRLLERRLEEVGDGRLRAIRALAVLDASGALVMEAFAGRPLPRLLLRSTLRQQPGPARPAALADAAGAWLRVLHDTPVGDSAPVRQGTPDELVACFAKFGEFLATAAPSRDLARTLEIGRAAAADIRELPVAISHGDFAPRNILVDGQGRIAVIDLLARWQAPRFEDLAAFLLAMRTSRVNATTSGLLFGRAIDRLEPAFLAGYFGSDPVPIREIRLYELLLLLDKWAARLARRAKGADGGLRVRLIDRYFDARSRHLARLLDPGR
ncbi:MAG TPA: phosphotransferase [Candidatus Limnocylindrales bacterium]|nr:phosphotransferase [Candidatus Limnocylindrales bacterium]